MQAQWRSVPRAKAAVAVIVVAAVIYNLPRFFERRVVIATCMGVSLPRTKKTALRLSRDYFLVYKTACYFIFRAVGPLVALIVLNAELVRALRVVRRRRRRLLVAKSNARGGGKNSGGENLTLMLVTVVTVFIVCQLPNLGIRIALTAGEFAPGGLVQLDIASLRYANDASNALLTLNSAINFAVYCLVGKKFRRIFVREIATISCLLQPARSDDGESVTIRRASQAVSDPHSRCVNGLEATQMTDRGQRRSCSQLLVVDASNSGRQRPNITQEELIG